MNIIFERLNEHEILLKWNNPQNELTTIDILSMDGMEERIAETAQNSCTLRQHQFCKPAYRLVCGRQKSIISERVLPLEGSNNFRDAGGYETENGMFVRWGKLYRSDHLHRLTDEEGVLEILCHSSIMHIKRNDTCPNPSISTKRLRHS
ncbi:tyrosine-protein phosphatase, partial [Erwinia mallotivora]|uniref:tyrosine-protein phosphatase n=1 Tax=Erwinia mallotivora TaxID=69222 RepID=UPI0035EB2298